MGQTSFTIDTMPIKKLNFTYLNMIQIRAAYMVPNATRVALHPIFVIIFITFYQVAFSTSYFYSWTSHCIVFCCFRHSCFIFVRILYFLVFYCVYIFLLLFSFSFFCRLMLFFYFSLFLLCPSLSLFPRHLCFLSLCFLSFDALLLSTTLSFFSPSLVPLRFLM